MKLAEAATREYRNWTTDSRRWAGYVPRPSDIVIATYPKCGTTWMQRIVGALVFQSVEPRPFSADISPWIDGRTRRSLDEVIANIDAQSHRRFLKSHLPFDGMPIYDGVKYIHVARDGRDAVMSWHDHDKAWLPAMIARLTANGLDDEAIGRAYPEPCVHPADTFHRWLTQGSTSDQSDGLPNLSWFSFEASWWSARHRPNVLMVHFKNLKSDLAGEIVRLAEFLEVPLADDLLEPLVQVAEFNGMKREGEVLLPHQIDIFKEGHRSFLNKGTDGRWVGLFRDEDLTLYDRKLAQSFSPSGAAWLEHGGPLQ
jgi:aryl sulfotransferase